MRATVRATVAPLLADARPSATQISQLLRGHHAELLERDGVWLRLRGVDGYPGWCHVGYVHLVNDTSDGVSLRSAWSDERRMSLGCTVRRPDGSQMSFPLGALLDADDVVVAGLAMNNRGRARYFAPEPSLLTRRALELFAGTPYLWGGVTPWGADCSGFVQTLFALHGVQLPRDAWQQGERGTVASDEAGELRPADLLFFSDRDDARITHVALSLGEGRVAHCALANGGFGVNALDADDPVAAQLRATYRFARRLW